MATLPDVAGIITALRPVLPDTSAEQIEDLAHSLVTAAGAQDAQLTDSSVGTLLHKLAGKRIDVGSTVFSFSGSQIGDVTIGDIAGRDIVKLHFHAAEQSYTVAGLPNPYLGLRAFSYTDRACFAGREHQVDTAIRLLTAPGEQKVLLFVTGASGSGKSSFAQAGLLPALEIYYHERNVIVRHAVIRPGKRPLAALADALLRLGLPPDGPFAAAQPFVVGVPSTPLAPAHIALLVIDQFEELFTQSDPEQRDTMFAILGALPPFIQLRLHLIATLRSDFLPDLFAHKTLYDLAKQGVDLRAMRVEELLVAIQRPLQETQPEKRFEPALAARLAEEASKSAAFLPLLQVTLEDLWRRGSLTLAAYGNLTDAVRQRAEDVYRYVDYDGARAQERSLSDQVAILDIFLDLVEVSLDDDHRRDVRRRREAASLASASSARERLIADMVQARLLSRDIEQRELQEIEVIDIIHESLISNWSRLQQAIAERRAWLQQRTRFEVALRVWLQEERSDAYVLSGVSLAEAEELAAHGDITVRDLEGQALLYRSRARQEEQRRRQLQRFQMTVTTLTLLLVITLSAAAWAFTQSRLAEERFQVARSQALAAAALEVVDRDPELALLLAIAGAEMNENRQTDDTLRRTLDASHVRSTLHGHNGSVYAAAWSPDETMIASVGVNGAMYLWDARTGHELAKLTPQHVLPPLPELQSLTDQTVQWHPDGSRLVTVSDDSMARVWDVASRREIWSDPKIVSAAWTPDGAELILVSVEDQDNVHIRAIAGLNADRVEPQESRPRVELPPFGGFLPTCSLACRCLPGSIVTVTPRLLKAARSRGRQAFLKKRQAVLASKTSWIESDLLRAGERPAEVARQSDYYALLKRRGRASSSPSGKLSCATRSP